jgi:hypothetical protein
MADKPPQALKRADPVYVLDAEDKDRDRMLFILGAQRAVSAQDADKGLIPLAVKARRYPADMLLAAGVA